MGEALVFAGCTHTPEVPPQKNKQPTNMTKTTMSLRPGASASVRLADQRLALAGRGHVARTSQPLAAPTQPQHQQRTRVVVQAVKKWIKPEVNKNTGKAVRKEMHVREGDTVKVISGKDKGKVGEVVKVYRKGLKAGKILVDDVNLMKKTQKPRAGSDEEKGKIILTESPIHHSNVMLYSTSKQQVSRVGHKVVNGKKQRYLIKTGEVLPERLPQKTPPPAPESEAEDE